jgi:hypothetical protein
MMNHEQKVSNQPESSEYGYPGWMTGLFNHTFMEQLITDAINRSKRSGRRFHCS